MSEDQAKIAKELLELEDVYQKSEFNKEQRKRWWQLVVQLFGDENAEQDRRFFRLPTKTTTNLKIGRKTFPAVIRDVSGIGIGLAGGVFTNVRYNDQVEIVSIDIVGKELSISLKCRIMHIDTKQSPPIVGVKISNENSPKAKQDFFKKVFYPLYLEYLKHLIQR